MTTRPNSASCKVTALCHTSTSFTLTVTKQLSSACLNDTSMILFLCKSTCVIVITICVYADKQLLYVWCVYADKQLLYVWCVYADKQLLYVWCVYADKRAVVKSGKVQHYTTPTRNVTGCYPCGDPRCQNQTLQHD
jgi:hypothetical protein